jgi:hypothetical protein
MFSKVNIAFPEFDLSLLKGRPLETYGPADAKLTIYSILDIDYFKEMHSGIFKFKIRPNYAFYTEIVGGGNVPPHMDPVVTACLNYYIEPADCTTTFYELKNKDAPVLVSVDKVNNLRSANPLAATGYDLEHLEEICHFKAEVNQSYLLNTQKIHSVEKPNDGVRKFISYRWSSYSFDEIKESLSEHIT